jgi:hypothetical protein
MHKSITEHFADEPDFVPIYLQTVFEGFPTNTFEAGLIYLEQTHGIEDPFYGHVAGTSSQAPAILYQYNDGTYMGTPYTLAVDKYGEPIVHNFSTSMIESTLTEMLEEALAVE